jgi:hypothetical protein
MFLTVKFYRGVLVAAWGLGFLCTSGWVQGVGIRTEILTPPELQVNVVASADAKIKWEVIGFYFVGEWPLWNIANGRIKRTALSLPMENPLYSQENGNVYLNLIVNGTYEKPLFADNKRNFLKITLKNTGDEWGYKSQYKDLTQPTGDVCVYVSLENLKNLMPDDYAQGTQVSAASPGNLVNKFQARLKPRIVISKFGVEVWYVRKNNNNTTTDMRILATHKGVYRPVTATEMGTWTDNGDTVKSHIRATTADDTTAPDNWRNVGTATTSGGVGAAIGDSSVYDAQHLERLNGKEIMRVLPANVGVSADYLASWHP